MIFGPAVKVHEDQFSTTPSPRASVISSSDMYSEQMQFYLAGENCLIRQSAITSDPYILSQIPLDDIAFKNASLLIFTS
nr:hypothetical protein [Candidatus Sigynarchaeota archaeon]